MIEHAATAVGVDLVIGLGSLLFRGRFVTAFMALAGAIAWVIRRPDRERRRLAPGFGCKRGDVTYRESDEVDRRPPSAPLRPKRRPGAEIAMSPLWRAGAFAPLPGGYGGPSDAAPTMPTSAQQPFATVIDGPREWSFATAAEYVSFLSNPPLLSDSPCIRWIKRVDGPHSVTGRKCPTCGVPMYAGETHAPRPPRPADMIRTTRAPAAPCVCDLTRSAYCSVHPTRGAYDPPASAIPAQTPRLDRVVEGAALSRVR